MVPRARDPRHPRPDLRPCNFTRRPAHEPLLYTSAEARISASGSAGARSITRPGAWTIPASVTSSGSAYRLEYQGGDPATVVLKRPPVVSPPFRRR